MEQNFSDIVVACIKYKEILCRRTPTLFYWRLFRTADSVVLVARQMMFIVDTRLMLPDSPAQYTSPAVNTSVEN